MSIELHLTFVGLTALVPRKDKSDPNEAREWLVVIPSLATGETLTKGDRTFTIQPHQAVLMANALAVRNSTTKRARLRIEDSENGRSDALFQLEHEALTIDSGTPGLLRSNGATGTVPLQPHELHDMKWVPPIHVSFDRSLLDPVTLQPEDALAGVVLLDRGTLETVDVHRKLGTNEPVSFQFRRGDGTPVWEQALANGFRLRVPVDQDEATLVLTDENGDPKRLVVGVYEGCPRNGQNVPIVEVQVFNRELEHILGFGAPDLAEVEADLADTDFALFYSLSPEWGGLSANDLVLPYNTQGGGGADRKPCEPPTFSGFGT